MNRFLILTLFVLASCGRYTAERQTVNFEPLYQPEIELANTDNNPGTSFNPARGNLFSMESRAQMVGDIITVQFAESFAATKSQNAASSKKSGSSVTLPSIIEAVTGATAADLSSQLTAASDQSFTGSGSTAQSNSLTGQVSVHVVRVYSNGNLEILGQKKLTLNNGDEYIRLHGIVRPQDISSQNVVSSDRIANANIEYIGAGDIASSGLKGWYSKFLDTVDPT